MPPTFEGNEASRAEIDEFDKRARRRFVPHKIDILHEYYLPLTTFAREGNPARIDNRPFYYKTHFDLLEKYKGKTVLNVACGIGELSLLMAHMGINVVAFDFSPASVEAARQMAEINGYGDRIRIDEMDVRDLQYEPDSFDLITGEHALHHLIKYENSLENLYRVLKPAGTALFWENFAFDPIIRILRPLNWRLKGYVGEHSLDARDLEYIDRTFDAYTLSRESVFYTYSRFFRRPNRFCRAVGRHLKSLDDRLLLRFPALKKYYSLAFLEMHKTHQTEGPP